MCVVVTDRRDDAKKNKKTIQEGNSKGSYRIWQAEKNASGNNAAKKTLPQRPKEHGYSYL